MMEDITTKLSELLNSPDGMEKLRSAANAILGDNAGGFNPEPPARAAQAEEQSQPGGILPDGLLDNIGNIQGIMRVMSLLNNKENDKRAGLLLALKPHLSEERAKRVDRAVSILRIVSLLPVLREEGLLESLGL